ncbi:MAG: 16S rRNA (guanine(527)-N(7))-methyltransferase RsmG [Pararhodobacter sp.]|nr:16S rRNA (guanine(527)-N(7))-methyltransferase RsmG [Pararhodobacter sp.]
MLPSVNVSRETRERLEVYAEQLRRWTKTVNLVSRNEIGKLWHRHIVDSAQLWPLRNQATRRWVDLGSGGGLPGVVLAILAAEKDTGINFHLVESDKRKAAFLRMMSAELGLKLTIHTDRAEILQPLEADTLTARALAPLPILLGYVSRHLSPDGVALLPKGHGVHAEMEEALQTWQYAATVHPSVVDSGSVILQITNIRRREQH